jgi:Sel1 repeat-containing protein
MPVPDRADKFDADALNPLLNPLLASHMGRWAEVYFTNPPEKREQAVSELLRELERVAVPGPASVQGAAGRSAKQSTDAVPSSASESEVVYTCGVCAYNNSAGHSFCGMCGAPLQVAPETAVPRDARRVEESAAIAGSSQYERSLDPAPAAEAIKPAVNSNAAREPGEAREARWEHMEEETDTPHRGVEPEPPPHLYRLYIGPVLAIILAAFGFGVWRGSEARSGASALSSKAASPSAQPASIRSAQPADATAPALPPQSQPVSAVQNQKQAVASSAEGPAGGSQIAPQSAPVPESSEAAGAGAVAATQNGAGELAIAEQYLNGTSGMTRDSGEAAQWLWKAVSKRNVEATLALSDLYSRGDGVPKNCDQARLLLDAAARKGSPAAAERLRKLEASNCD